jgi:hypothetical protein
MPAVVTAVVEFESDAEAITFHDALNADKRVHGAMMRLSDGREIEFDHHKDELEAKRDEERRTERPSEARRLGAGAFARPWRRVHIVVT